jgi:hypothetical protein
MSIVRVGLSNKKFAAGYDAIFGGKRKVTNTSKKPKAKSGKKKK